MAHPTGDADRDPVTMVVSRVVRPGREPDFERWVSGIVREALGFEGHLGANVIRPHAGQREYAVILKFADYDRLRSWAQSPQREDWLRRLEGLTEGDDRVQVLTGLESWFELPGSGVVAPARHKMVALTFLGLYPLLLLNRALFGRWLDAVPVAAGTAASTLVLLVLMTYVVMPRITAVFARWLYPDR